MHDLSQNGLAHDQVLEKLYRAIDEDRVQYRLDVTRSGIKITEAKYMECTLECDSQAEVKNWGSMTILDNPLFNWETDYIVPVMYFDDFYFPFVPLKVLTDVKTIDGEIITHNIEAYDRSYLIHENSVGEILYFEQGTLYTAAIMSILERFGITDTNIVPSPKTLTTTREDWEESDFIITIVNQLLEEINYTPLTVDRAGVFYSRLYEEPTIANASIYYNSGLHNIVFPPKRFQLDSYKKPNRFIGSSFNPDMEEPLSFEYIITDPSIPISTIRQGIVRTAPVIQYDNVASLETLEQLVIREAMETARTFETTEMTTRIMPHHGVLDVLAINANGLQGIYEETGWSIDYFGPTGKMSHHLRRVVYD